MSIVQPENGLPERRIVTADSFRALKLRLSGVGRRPAMPPPLPPHQEPVAEVPLPKPQAVSLVSESPPAEIALEPPAAEAELAEAASDQAAVIALAYTPLPVETNFDTLVDEASTLPEPEADAPPSELEAQTPPPEPEAETLETLAIAPAEEASALPEPEADAPPSEPEAEPEAQAPPSEPEAEALGSLAAAPVEDEEKAQPGGDEKLPDSELAIAEIAIEEEAAAPVAEAAAVIEPPKPAEPAFVERRILEQAQPEDSEAGEQAHQLLDIMAVPTTGSLPQERALANDTLLRLIPRMPLKSLRRLAERVGVMEAPSQMLVRRLINDPRIEVAGPLLENAMIVDDSDLIAVAQSGNPAKLRLIARRRIISPALAEALIQSNHADTLLNLVRNSGASFSIESMWRLTRFAALHPLLQAPLVTRPDTPSPIAFHLFWRLPSELRRYVLSRFLTDSETISRILTMNREGGEGPEPKSVDLALLAGLSEASPSEAGIIFSRLTNVSAETGARIAEDEGGEALTVALKAAGLSRAQFAGIIDKRADAEALKSIFDTLSFNKARVLLTYWDWAARRTGPYARTAAA